MLSFLKRLFGTAQERTLRRYQKQVEEINRFESKFSALSNDELKAKTAEFKERVQKGESIDSLLPEAYAAVKNACRRLIGTDAHVSGYNQKWDMVPYDVQLLGAIALHHGSIAEMQTGEGKTLTASLPLYLNALTGKPVHTVTVNDYLAARDCEWINPIFKLLGLSTGVLRQEMDPSQRKSVYACDIVYGTASEFGFDYLRDNSMASRKEDQVQRGHYFAIIDEVDSILIDEARTPLIISGPSAASKQLYDILKEPVSALVKKQKDDCQRLALEAKRALERFWERTPEKTELNDNEKKACKLLWLVNKGTPKNKILKKFLEEPEVRAAVDKWDLYYYSEGNKEEKAKELATLFITVDEKANEYELTDKGIQAWADCGGKEDDFVMLDLGHELLMVDHDKAMSDPEKLQKKLSIQQEDSVRKERAHNLRQLLRAHLLMEKDVDYIIQDSKIVIIDENTGRPQPGRRFSDGLHQAIEAKEEVPIQRETQTYATITLQNYFRLYDKLAGMSGTAITEAQEFKDIYKLQVLQIPTHKTCVRNDMNDEMYMTEREKYGAILSEVRALHDKGQPILLGTESVEVSEKLSRLFRLNKLDHVVLNAKNHLNEAEVIAGAGRRGAITIATNMAGRGTDIKLESGVSDVGGLYVLGSTRHQARRIDRQLRGRSGRQGDPGVSKFFISLEDPLMRLFASPSLTALLQRFRPPEGEPISASILNKSIETAQKRIEQRNSTMRKHTLEYDDVMNKQRQAVYAFRNDLLHTTEPMNIAQNVIKELCEQGAAVFFVRKSGSGRWDPEGFRQFLAECAPVGFEDEEILDERFEVQDYAQRAEVKILDAFKKKAALELDKLQAMKASGVPMPEPETILGETVRNIMVRTVDHLWQEHLLAMDHLRSDVHLRAVGQKDPLVEFKHESFRLFSAFMLKVREEVVQILFRFQIIATPPPINPPAMPDNIFARARLEHDRSFADELDGVEEAEIVPPSITEPIIHEDKEKRNELCSCGSGKKFKKCCGA